ncbi:MAG: hypothetical protein LBR64_00410 [Dysgonamonadaceae bacterium]|nr:hypothetical protein [Dysgonamonadaceae bacterium]
MKKIYFIFIALLTMGVVNKLTAQVTIGANSTPRATLDLIGKASDATSRDGLVIPSMTGNELKNKMIANTYPALGGAARGTLIFVSSLPNTDDGIAIPSTMDKITAVGFYFLNGSSWEPLATGSDLEQVHGANQDRLVGNEILDVIAGRGLVRAGLGNDASPYKVGIREGATGKVLVWEADTVAWEPYIAGPITVGLDEKAVTGALLQVKSVDDATSAGQVNATQGIGLPRVALVSDTLLAPMYSVSDAQSLSAAVRQAHKGLFVYNLTDDEANNLDAGIYYWDGEKWAPLQKGAQKAIFEVDCSSVEVRGSYGNGVSLDNSHYLKLNIVNVTRSGSYSITATSNPDNGYFFEQVGNFYSEGSFALTIPGTGQPIDPQTDSFTLTISGGSGTCSFTIPVKDMTIPRNFTMDCSKTVVNGMYFEDEQIGSDPAHGPQTISVTINVQAASIGSTIEMQTNEVDGISFSGSTIVTTTPTQTITLQGTGTPRGLNDKIFTITCNSAISTASCTATLHMLIPRKRLLAIGMSSVYGYNPGDVGTRNPRNDLNALLTDENNFGYNQWSILRFAGFKNKTGENWVTGANSWTDDDRDIIAMTGAVWNAMSPSRLERLLKGSDGKPKIDIVMIGHDAAYCNATTGDAVSRADLLTEFVKNGGILMICSEITASNQNFMRRFFNDASITGTGGAGAGSRYTLAFNTTNMPAEMKPYYCKDDDPILVGPFENIVGREWGEDSSTTTFISNLPLDEIIIYSGAREIGNTTRSAEGVTIFRHREYPFVFMGDGGFNSGETRTYTGATACPFRLTSKTIDGHTYSNYPTYRPNYGSSSGRAYNAVFSANAFAWCIEKAEEWRRNHK